MRYLSPRSLRLSLVTLVAAPALALAQRSTNIGIAGGIAIPTGLLTDAQSTGFTVLGTLGFGVTSGSTVSLRLDGAYNRLDGKTVGFVTGESLRILSATGNLVLSFPTNSSVTPYLIGGGGLYNSKYETSDSRNDFGLNGGFGLRFALSGFSTFGEVRLHNMFWSNGGIVGSGSTSVRFVPITFGILF